MIGITPENAPLFNQNLKGESPEDVVSFVLEHTATPIITTSFGGYSEVLIHSILSQSKHIPVIWVDTGLNTPQTYAHADYLKSKYNLNLHIVSPLHTPAYLEYHYGVPGLENPNHEALSKILKHDPLTKALRSFGPDVWFTNLRKTQTSHRQELDILSFSPDGLLKVSPFFNYSELDLATYVTTHNLKTEFRYTDPVKALSKRECGIHFTN